MGEIKEDLHNHEEDRHQEHLDIKTEPLWTVEDVARYLRLKPETVRMLARNNKIPGRKVGKVWRFRAREVKTIVSAKVAGDE